METVLLPLGGLETLCRHQVPHLSSQKVLCSSLGTNIILLGFPFTNLIDLGDNSRRHWDLGKSSSL